MGDSVSDNWHYFFDSVDFLIGEEDFNWWDILKTYEKGEILTYFVLSLPRNIAKTCPTLISSLPWRNWS